SESASEPGGTVVGGTTSSVMLCGGSETAIALPVAVRSARRALALLEVSRQTWTGPPTLKFARLTVVAVVPESRLATSMTVSAPSVVRRAGKADRLSGAAG